jgi:uncharacterized protein (TIGR02145 family)
MKRILFWASLLLWLITPSCKKDDPLVIVGDELEGDGSFEYDGRTYAFKFYGDQTWMIENLAYLPSVSPSSGESAGSALYYVYDYEGSSISAAKATANYQKYGVLYNWEAAKTACPPGWHLPTDEEWKTLEILYGMDESEASEISLRSSGSVGYYMKSTIGWSDDGNGENYGGFTVLPGGSRVSYNGGEFNAEGFYGLFWTSTENGSTNAWSRQLYWSGPGVYRDNLSRSWALSVRCVKDLD